jgi:hypothetical protein
MESARYEDNEQEKEREEVEEKAGRWPERRGQQISDPCRRYDAGISSKASVCRVRNNKSESLEPAKEHHKRGSHLEKRPKRKGDAAANLENHEELQCQSLRWPWPKVQE